MNGHVWNVAELEPGTVVAGWRVQKRLGVGGYGAVYLVESVEQPGALGALKMFFHPQDIRAGREQSLLVDKAMHPNVVRCLGAGRWPHPIQGHPFLVLEYVPGPPLHLWVEENNPEFSRLAYLGAEVALALGHLHARGVLHRDLKPEHVVVRETDRKPVLVDFGVGDYTGANTLTETPLPPGTAHLRSPEAACFWLAHGDKPRARYDYRPSDELYALGVCLYRATTGHYPFPAGADVKFLLYMDIAHRVPPPPVEVNPRVPLVLSDVITRLLAKHPEARYRNGEEVHAALLAAATFGGREPWEASVFEWEEVPTGEAPEGAITARRRIRRPPPPVREQQPTQPKGPPPAEPPASEPAISPPGRLPRAVLAATAALMALLMVTVVLIPRGWRQEETPQVTASDPPAAVQEVAHPAQAPDTAPAPAPLPPAEDPPEATVQPVRHTESVSMKKNSPPSKQSEQKPATDEATSSDAWKRAMMVCLLYGGTACTGAQVRPQPGDCPPEALAAMRSLRQAVPGTADVWLDVTKPHSRVGLDNYTDGPIISSIAYSTSDIPEGSVLYGWLWVTGNGVDAEGYKKVYGRWDKLKLPDGREMPVCFILADSDGVEEVEVGPPGYARFPRIAPLMSVKRFVFE
ncbi:serine/threonine protein kinase [Archangium lipolyticum]|uniref:serine/threonine protein kinase n=1 Tax=Archangium lipolyticum TaxID=2970465 RepID=UPI0021499ADD|nr:serine/threonine-protein kinase [Archangium lipolyticum]